MARINIEDSLLKDYRFTELCIKSGSRITAIGIVFESLILAQKHYIANEANETQRNSTALNGSERLATESNETQRNSTELNEHLIPFNEWKRMPIIHVMIEVGLAEIRENGVYIKGTEKAFAWLLQKRKAGKKSAASRKKSSKRIKQHFESTEVNETQRNSTESNGSERNSTALNGSERLATESNGSEPLYSSSFSSSYSSSSSNSFKNSSNKKAAELTENIKPQEQVTDPLGYMKHENKPFIDILHENKLENWKKLLLKVDKIRSEFKTPENFKDFISQTLQTKFIQSFADQESQIIDTTEKERVRKQNKPKVIKYLAKAILYQTEIEEKGETHEL